jgi:hypothetical protein
MNPQYFEKLFSFDEGERLLLLSQTFSLHYMNCPLKFLAVLL